MADSKQTSASLSLACTNEEAVGNPEMRVIKEAMQRIEAERDAEHASNNRAEREAQAKTQAEARARQERDAARLAEQRLRRANAPRPSARQSRPQRRQTRPSKRPRNRPKSAVTRSWNRHGWPSRKQHGKAPWQSARACAMLI